MLYCADSIRCVAVLNHQAIKRRSPKSIQSDWELLIKGRDAIWYHGAIPDKSNGMSFTFN